MRHIAPEFPLRHSDDNRSSNLDYLMFREGPKPAWIFVELKTEGTSFREEQLEVYRVAQGKGMNGLLADADKILGATTARHRAKYEHLVRAVRDVNHAEAPILVLYLAPPRAEEPPAGVTWISLAEFARWTPGRYTELWPSLRDLLRAIDAAE